MEKENTLKADTDRVVCIRQINYDNPRTTAKITVTVAHVISTAWNLIWNFAHLPQSSFAAARAPRRHPEVGTIKLVNASPSWNATTATWRSTPTRSARGAITGMVRAAWPEPDTTKKLNTDWNTYISHAETTAGKPCIPWLIP